MAVASSLHTTNLNVESKQTVGKRFLAGMLQTMVGEWPRIITSTTTLQSSKLGDTADIQMVGVECRTMTLLARHRTRHGRYLDVNNRWDARI